MDGISWSAIVHQPSIAHYQLSIFVDLTSLGTSIEIIVSIKMCLCEILSELARVMELSFSGILVE